MTDHHIYANIYAELRKKCCVDLRPAQVKLRIYAAFRIYANIYAELRTDFVLPGRAPPWQGRGWVPRWRTTHHAPRVAREHFGSIYASTRLQPEIDKEAGDRACVGSAPCRGCLSTDTSAARACLAAHSRTTMPRMSANSPSAEPLLPTEEQRVPRLGGSTGKGWTPGRSGNPHGRPKAPFDIAAMCREHAAEAVATLVQALQDPRHKVAAAEALLDRGFGKPRQIVETPDGASPLLLHFLAASQVSTELRAELERRGRPVIDGMADAVEPPPSGSLLDAPLPEE